MLTPALEAALDFAVARYVDVSNLDCEAHRAYIGEVKRGGKPTGEIGVVVVVPRKLPFQMLRVGETLPSSLRYGNQTIRVDVQEAPQAEITLLRLGPGQRPAAYSSADHVQCQSPLVPGGAQIQPAGASWVGTLGCMMVFDEGQTIGAITNAHVTGETAPAGTKMTQPDSRNGRYFGQVLRVAPIQMNRQAKNRIDLALLNCRDAQGRHTCTPQQIQIGRLGNEWHDAWIGEKVIKSGRTTGVTRGRCTGIKGVSLVGYDAGKVARFVDLDVYESDSGDFSQPGDSGSAILNDGNNDFVSLLFAGGGGQTLGCMARHVLEFTNGYLFD